MRKQKAAATPRTTRGPIYAQWLGVKRQLPQAIIFIEMGDFYETFEEDARTCDHEGLLTARVAQWYYTGDSGPLMAGLPKVGMPRLREALLARGYAVGIVDQVRVDEA